MLNVLLIDDHPVTNAGLAVCLEGTGRFTVIGQVASLTEAEYFIEKEGEGTSHTLPSCIILDILLGEDNGLEFLPFLETYCKENKIPKPPVLVCSVIEDSFRIQTTLEMGAAGYLPKSGSLDEIIDAIDIVLKGETYIPPRHKTKVSENPKLFTLLTQRETEVLALIRQNHTNTQIAENLHISEKTVKNHITNIYFKTATASREDLLKL